METRVDTYQADTGATLEVGTITGPNGQEFAACGAEIDLAGGHVMAYVDDNGPHPSHARRALTTWGGTMIGHYSVTSTWRNRYGYEQRAISARLAGDDREWYGRYGSDWSQLVHLRPRKHSPMA